MLAHTDDLKRMTAGAPIFMPSYSLHYDRSSERPVMRGGIVSSDPDSDYLTDGQEPARRVLYQAQSAEELLAPLSSRLWTPKLCFWASTPDSFYFLQATCHLDFLIASRRSVSRSGLKN